MNMKRDVPRRKLGIDVDIDIEFDIDSADISTRPAGPMNGWPAFN
jgi:hypothetical protein